MRKIILMMTVVLVTATSGIGYAASNSDQENVKTSIDPATYNSPCLTQPNDKTEVNRRGCCSHHGGVCGCENGRAKCCDGTLSPTCGC